MADPEVVIERLSEYSDEIAAELGSLMPHLSRRLSDRPWSEERLRAIIDSPYHDQLVARMNGRIVGAATLSLIMSPEHPRNLGWLGAFVTHPDVRGRGIGEMMWNEMLDWCEEHKANLEFTSRPDEDREAARRFYLSHWAYIRGTDIFHVDVGAGE